NQAGVGQAQQLCPWHPNQATNTFTVKFIYTTIEAEFIEKQGKRLKVRTQKSYYRVVGFKVDYSKLTEQRRDEIIEMLRKSENA
ncbi:hypothetical protein IWQ61_010375, partial [Dispira simplex]